MAPPLLANDPSGDQPVILYGHSRRVWSVAFSPSSQFLASGSSDSTIRLWDVETGNSIASLRGHSDVIYCAVFSPDSAMLASGSEDSTIKLWDVRSRTETTTLSGHTSSVYSVAFSPNGLRLVSGSHDHTIRLWDLKTGSNTSTLRGHSGEVRSVIFSPDGKTIASGSNDRTIRLWHATSGACFLTFGRHSDEVASVGFSPSGEHLTSGSRDKTIRVWDVATGAQTGQLEGHSAIVRSVQFSPTGKHLASASDDKTVRLWDIESMSHILTLEDHSDGVNSVAFSPNNTRLASGSDDHTMRIWKLSQETSGVRAVLSTPDSAGLAKPTTSNQQETVTSASTLVQLNNDTSLTNTTIGGYQDLVPSVVTPVPLNNDITGSVSLQSNTPVGYGGFGDLFLGIHTDHGKVALKKPRRLLNEALIRRFLREVNLWCSVSHPNVLPCLGMCKIGLDVYVVSPFIESGDLLSCMGRGQALNRSKLLFEVAEALTHLHHKGIVHGDVKAQNILLADDGSALLCDFGLAKAFDTMATSTEAKGAGSVRWMAPELFLDESRSMASDVYSLGITIAEVLSGRAPYPNITESFAVMLHVAYHDGRPAKEPLASPEGKSYVTLWQTAEKCWVKDPKARPYMAQVLAMLFPLTREKA